MYITVVVYVCTYVGISPKMVFNASCVFQYTFSDSSGTEKKGNRGKVLWYLYLRTLKYKLFVLVLILKY